MEIQIPVVGGFVGPGFSVTGTVQGPTQLDEFVEVYVSPASSDLERVIYGCDRLEGSTIFAVELGNTSSCGVVTQPVAAIGFTQGQDARVTAVHRRADGVQLDSISVQVKWDGAGMLFRYGDSIGWGSSGQGSFTPSDRDVLEHIDSAVWKPWPNG